MKISMQYIRGRNYTRFAFAFVKAMSGQNVTFDASIDLLSSSLYVKILRDALSKLAFLQYLRPDIQSLPWRKQIDEQHFLAQ